MPPGRVSTAPSLVTVLRHRLVVVRSVAAGWPVLFGSATDLVSCTVGLLEIFTAHLLSLGEPLVDVCP